MQTFFRLFLAFVLPFAIFGCSDSPTGSLDESETAELSFTIKNAESTSKATIERTGVRGAEEGDLLNITVEGTRDDNSNNYSDSKYKVSVPPAGEAREVSFTVPLGDYDVDLAAYTPQSANVSNSLILAATTGSGEAVDVDKPGIVRKVDFTPGQNENSDAEADLFTTFNYTYDVPLELTDGGGQVSINIDLSDGSSFPKNFERFIEGGGGIGVSPADESITDGDISSANDTGTFSLNGSTLSTSVKLPVGQYKDADGKANVLVEFAVPSRLEAPGQELSVFNNVDGSAQQDVSLEGDGGIIIIF